MSETNKYVNSLLFSLYITQSLICVIISYFITIPYISVFVTLFLFVLLLCYNTNIPRGILKRLTILIVIAFALLISGILNSFSAIFNYLAYFIVFGVSAAFFSVVEVDYSRVTRGVLIVYFIYMISYALYGHFELMSNTNYWSIQMGKAYTFVQIFLLSFFVLIHPYIVGLNSKEGLQKKIMLFLLAISSVTYMLIDCATRGAIVVLIIGVALVIIAKENNWKIWICLIAFVLLALWVILNYDLVINFFVEIFSAFNLNISVLIKAKQYLDTDNVLNGRESLSIAAQKYFLESPFWGHGVGYFESKTNNSYVHNIILQLLCEYGILGALPILLFLLNKIKCILTSPRNENNIFMLFLFSITIPELFFSNTYWMMPHFWAFVFLDVDRIRKKGDI